MIVGKHENRDEEPQEEFVGKRASKKDRGDNPDPVKYEQWSIEDLRRKAKEKNIAGYDKLDRNELIKNLKRL